MNSLELSTSVFSILSSYIEERVGISYSPRDLELLREKASARASEIGFESLLDYYYFLRYDLDGERELNELVENLVVNETYFFREWPGIESLVKNFIEPWVAEGRRPRIWSAACATGEEPLSLAMLLDDLDILDKVEIVATDISARALAKASLGKFGKRSIRSATNERLREKYLSFDGSQYTISPRILNSVRWSRKNLLERMDISTLGKFDAILCRNVMIYFSDQTIRHVLDSLSDALNDDGVLFIGVSESLLRYSGHFQGEERGGAFVYKKVPHS